MFIIRLSGVKTTIAASRNLCPFKCSTAGSHHKNFVPHSFHAVLCGPEAGSTQRNTPGVHTGPAT